MAYRELWDHRFQLDSGKWVFVQSENSKTRGREIAERIYEEWIAPRYFYHLYQGHVEALKYHLNHRSFACVDIANFFGRINRTRVTRVLKSLFGYTTAREYAKVSVVRDPSHSHMPPKYMLPFGFTQSPLLASLCLDASSVGDLLKKIDVMPELRLSVYVDDIIISSNDIEKLKEVFDRLKTAVNRSGWALSTTKTQPPNVAITAFNICTSYGNLTITEGRMEEFAEEYVNATSDYVKEGIVSYVTSVNPAQARKFDGL